MSRVLQFRSWGFDLYVPPTPFSQPPKPERFVMFDDRHNVFYDVDYQTPKLGNSIPWVELGLHNVEDPAIVFPPEQQNMLELMKFATGLLVSIESRAGGVLHARCLGRVNVSPFPQERVNSSALRGLRGAHFVADMRAGLLRRVWAKDRTPVQAFAGQVATPGFIVDNMSQNWHQEGARLNHMLEERFVGAQTIDRPSTWRVSNLSHEQMLVSTTRAAVFIDH